jgi:hypothetical protein
VPELPYTADPVPATPIGHMQNWQLHIQCARCRRHSKLSLDYLAQHYGSQRRVIDVILRLQCGNFRGSKKCRGRPGLVTLVRVAVYGKSVRPLRQITVVDASNPWPQLQLASRPL